MMHVQKKIEFVNKYRHNHCYVFEILQKHRYSTTHETVSYTLLTNVEGPAHPDNRKWLEQGLRAAFGYMPKSVKYKYDKYK